MTNSITAMLEKLDDTSIKTDKKHEKLIELSSKLSTYEYHLDKANINNDMSDLSILYSTTT